MAVGGLAFARGVARTLRRWACAIDG